MIHLRRLSICAVPNCRRPAICQCSTLVARYADLLKQLGRKDEAKKLQDRITLAKAEAPSLGASTGGTPGGNTAAAPKEVKADKGKPALAKLVSEAKDPSNTGDKVKAITCWKAVVQEAEKSEAKDGRLPYALVHLGDAYRMQGSDEEAVALYKRAMEIREKEGATKSLGMVRNITRLANMELQKKNSVEASRLFIRALDLEDQQNAPDAIVAATLQNMITTCTSVQDNAHAEQAAKRLIPLAEKIGGATGNMQKRMAVTMLGVIYMKSGRMNEGMQLMRSMSNMPKPNKEDFADTMKHTFTADEAIYDKSEEASFLN